MNFWPEKPGFTVIKQDHVHFLEDIFQAVEGGGRVQGHGGLGPQFLDVLDQALQVDGGLHMNAQPIGAGVHEVLDVALRVARSSGGRPGAGRWPF